MPDQVTHTVSIAALDEWGRPLLGRRRDNGKWSLPGGVVAITESVIKAAVRKLFEETGLRPDEITYLGNETVGTTTVHAFRARVSGTPTPNNDPNREFSEWHFIQPQFHELPAEVLNNLHDPKNVALDFLGYQDWRGSEARRHADHHFWSPKPKGNVERIQIHPDTVMDEAMYRPRRPDKE